MIWFEKKNIIFQKYNMLIPRRKFLVLKLHIRSFSRNLITGSARENFSLLPERKMSWNKPHLIKVEKGDKNILSVHFHFIQRSHMEISFGLWLGQYSTDSSHNLTKSVGLKNLNHSHKSFGLLELCKWLSNHHFGSKKSLTVFFFTWLHICIKIKQY